jgi:hypothetical protein
MRKAISAFLMIVPLLLTGCGGGGGGSSSSSNAIPNKLYLASQVGTNNLRTVVLTKGDGSETIELVGPANADGTLKAVNSIIYAFKSSNSYLRIAFGADGLPSTSFDSVSGYTTTFSNYSNGKVQARIVDSKGNVTKDSFTMNVDPNAYTLFSPISGSLTTSKYGLPKNNQNALISATEINSVGHAAVVVAGIVGCGIAAFVAAPTVVGEIAVAAACGGSLVTTVSQVCQTSGNTSTACSVLNYVDTTGGVVSLVKDCGLFVNVGSCVLDMGYEVISLVTPEVAHAPGTTSSGGTTVSGGTTGGTTPNPTTGAPASPTISAPGTATQNAPVNISVTRGVDPEGDQVKVECTASGSSYASSPYASPLGSGGSSVTFSVNFTATGSQNISCVSVDSNGNRSAAATRIITVSLTGAVVTLPGAFSVNPGSAYCNGTTPAITFDWQASTDAISYDVYRNGSLYASGLTSAGGNNITNVTAGQTYTYYVIARNANGSTQSNNTISVSVPLNVCSTTTPPIVTVPATMTSPASGSKLIGANVTFTWNSSIPAATQYMLYFGTTTGGSDLGSANAGTALSFQITGLPTNGHIVFVRLSSLINGAWSYIDYTYDAYTSSAPTNVQLFNGYAYCDAGTTPAVRMSYSASGMIGYNFYRNGVMVSPLDMGTSFADDTGGVTAGQTYQYYFIARNFAGTATSNTISVSVPLTICPKPAPYISGISSNPVRGSNSPQPFNIYGSNFVSGANVILRDLTMGQTFSNRSSSYFSSTMITLNPNFTTAVHTWSVEVINPDGQTSGQFNFSVM